LDDDALIEDLMTMALPQISSGISLSDWSAATCAPGTNYPPSFAMLKGLDNFCVRISHCRCILGKASASAQSLVTGLGDAERGAEGLSFEYNNSLRGGSTHSKAETVSPFPSLHIGFHGSIARRHALIDWNPQRLGFQIRSLSSAGLVLNGTQELLPQDGPVPLQHRTIVQIGCKIFFFLLPMKRRDPSGVNFVDPITHNLNVTRAMVQSAQYRQLAGRLCAVPEEGEAAAEAALQAAFDETERYEIAALGGVFPGGDSVFK
jgi:hypothetical protein